MKKIILLFFFLFSTTFYSQSLIQTVNLPTGTYWNSAYGLVYANGKYWVTSGSSTVGRGIIYGLNNEGVVVDTITIQHPVIRESQGLAHDGTNFWYIERKTARSDLYKVSPQGVVLDSIYFSTINAGTSWFCGGAAWDGSHLWVSVYSPDAQAALYKIDVNAKQIVDTLSVFGLQPTGITIKGDTLIYTNDGFSSNGSQGFDMIYVVNMNTKDTLFTFRPPHPNNVTNAMRGLAWDGEHFWLMAKPVGSSTGRNLYVYDLDGGGTPGITVITQSVGFGNVQIDSTVNSQIFLKNYGTANLIIDSIYVSNPAFTFNQSAPITIAPDITQSFPISFKPKENITYTDTIYFYHNDPNFVYSIVTLSGTGVFTAPYIGLSDANLNYGNKRINSTSYMELTFTNSGSATLVVDSLNLLGENYYFENAESPFSIDSVQSKTIRVWFNPDAYSTFTDSILIYSNASNGTLKIVPLSGTGVTFNPDLGNIVWQGQMPPRPGTTYNTYKVTSMAKMDDVNDDGIEDLIVTNNNYWTIAFNGNSSGTGDILWKFSSYGGNSNAGSVDYSEGMKIASDLNGDGFKDVVIGTAGGNEFVYAISGKNGKRIWGFGDSINPYNGDIMGIDVKRDWTGDNIPDVLATASGNESTGDGRFSVYLLNGATGEMIWRLDQSAQKKLKYNVVSTDFGGAAGSRVGSSNEVIGFDRHGLLAWSFPTNGTPWPVREIDHIGGTPGSDVIAGTTTGWVYALNGEDGVLLWSRQIGSVFITDLVVTPDLTGSGYQDIFVSGINPNVYLLEGSTGNIVWQAQTGGNILGKGIVGDLNADGFPELATASLNNMLHVYESRQGLELFTYAFGTGGNGTAAEQVKMVGDIDGNLSNEFAAGSRDGRVIVFSGGTDVIPVEFTAFSANLNGSTVSLTWSTATELNNQGFAVERKSSEGSFVELAFVPGNGTTTEPTTYIYNDIDVSYGTYYYRLKQIDFDGTYEYSKEIEVNVGLPIEYALEQNYPNPFNPSTIIKYSVPFDGNVKLSVFNILGEEVATLVNEIVKAGYYTMEWNPKNKSNVSLPSGTYFYRLEAGNFVDVKKMMFIK